MSRFFTWLAAALTLGVTLACPPRSQQPGDSPQSPPPPEPVAAAVAAEPGAAPELVLEEQRFEAGRVQQGEVVTHVFVVKNRGLGELNIEKVQGSWGCTAALVSERKVAPGGQAEIEVKVNTAGRRGKLGKVVRIYSNDPKQPVASVAVEIDIEVPGEPEGPVKPPQKPARRLPTPPQASKS